MVATNEIAALPKTLAEFILWKPEDGLNKYEWNDGEIIKFTGMNKKQLYIYEALNNLFVEKGFWKIGTFVAKYDTMLSGIQMRRPDVAYFTKEQVRNTKEGIDEIPAFVVEIISTNDKLYEVEKKITEYFKHGVKVVWNILPDEKTVHVYTSRRNVKICFEDDICSAAPVLPEFEISVSQIFD